MAGRHLIVLGTHNRKKRRELAELLEPYGLELATLADFPGALEVVEDGHDFAANARRKACQQASHLGLWVLAEDSGLCVDALHGAPGVRSARYSGYRATDASNNDRLLWEMRDVPPSRRTAQYTCHITLADPVGGIRAEAEGRCRGRIAPGPRGVAGFGYDPLFELLEYHRTFAELGDAVKAVLSHRGRAVRRLIPQVAALVRQGAWQTPAN
ncbi:MAG: RdgB/HAM1 family non-canonical purine NTP pyrophosphatase [Planctomycetes bacterium]|nr:RdgB/HAM1 family non-canonical purine NTP pyrophosphatase [Planctomycetota bacterium]